MHSLTNGDTPSAMPRRERSTRTRAGASEDLEEMRWGSAAAMAASVKQAEDYKPREERGWEEFHPNLDIEQPFIVFTAEDVDGAPHVAASTPAAQTPGTPRATASMTPSRQVKPASTGNTPNPQERHGSHPVDAPNGTPSRRPRRQHRDVVGFYGARSIDFAATPKTPKILPIQNQTPKERLDLKLPSYRKTNRIELFESKTFGQARYVDKSMSNVGYQESDHFIRPDTTLIKALDGNAEDEAEQSTTPKADDHAPHHRLGRVEYDMDEQDDMWLEQFNAQRKQNELEAITREVFEITMTKIEKEWHALEKRIPKPNPKPPQTHRPRSSSAAAVNGETQAGDEPDSKCAVCDDGDCENTNAIVFCDGCNLAVHQECYGVPFIPEGQWLCRKCQLCGRGVPVRFVAQLFRVPACANQRPHRRASSAPTPTALSSRPTHPSGPTCSVPCGFPKSRWATTPSWNPSWTWRRCPRRGGSFLATFAIRGWGRASSAETRIAIRPFMLPAPGELASSLR